MSVNLDEAARILALKAVLCPDTEYRLRKIYRWYSQEFHTPLHKVIRLDLMFVLQQYYESEYEELPDYALHEIKKALLESPEQQTARRIAEDHEEVDNYIFEQEALEENEEAEKRIKAKRLADAKRRQQKPLIDLSSKKKSELPEFIDTENLEEPSLLPQALPGKEVTLDSAIQPDLHIEFEDPIDLEDDE
jgi:hypothetical protein